MPFYDGNVKNFLGRGHPLSTPLDACGASTLAPLVLDLPLPQMQFLDQPMYLAKIGLLHLGEGASRAPKAQVSRYCRRRGVWGGVSTLRKIFTFPW